MRVGAWTAGARRLGKLPQELFEDDAGCARIRIAGPLGMGLGGAVALVDGVDGQAEAAVELAGKTRGGPGHLVRLTVRVARDADHQRIGLPLGDEAGDGGKTGIALDLERRPGLCLLYTSDAADE